MIRILFGSTAVLVGLVALAGCGASAFSPHFRDNNALDMKEAIQDLKPHSLAPVNSGGKHLAFIVTTEPTKLVAYDLQGNKPLWTAKGTISSRIVVGSQRIFHLADRKTLVARDIGTGEQLWSEELIGGDRLVGMTTDGERVYYVTELVKRSLGGSIAYLVAVSASSGSKKWSRASSGRLGAPAVQDNRVFVPLRFQSISIINASSGVEIARVRSKEETLLWTRSSSAGVLFGGKNGLYRVDKRAISGNQKNSSFIAADLPESVRPVYWWDGYNAALSNYTAYDRNRLLWELEPDSMRFLGSTIYVHNYRFFFAFDTTSKAKETSNLRWAYSFPRHDVVASAFTGKALLLVSKNGHLITLDPHVGLPVADKDLKVEVRGVTFDAAGYVPPSRAKGKPNIRQTLAEVIWDPDRRFGAVKLFCVEELARLAGNRVSQDLVKIVTYEGIDPTVYKRAGDVLVARHDKAAIPLYVKTLKSTYSFINGTRGKAIDIMARALGDLKAPEAVRPLLMHLADHETSLVATEAVVRALAAIGDRSIKDPFRDFLLTYRCDPIFAKAPAALNLVAETLLNMGGEDERQLLSFIENDPHTLKSLRVYLGEVLRQSAQKKVSAKPTQRKKK